MGLVGESGCGKTSMGRILVRLEEVTGGSAQFDGQEIRDLRGAELQRFRSRSQMIFQNPFASLNPRMRVEDIIGEAPRVHGLVSKADLPDYVDDIMKKVGLDPSLKRRYAHQFSVPRLRRGHRRA